MSGLSNCKSSIPIGLGVNIFDLIRGVTLRVCVHMSNPNCGKPEICAKSVLYQLGTNFRVKVLDVNHKSEEQPDELILKVYSDGNLIKFTVCATPMLQLLLVETITITGSMQYCLALLVIKRPIKKEKNFLTNKLWHSGLLLPLPSSVLIFPIDCVSVVHYRDCTI